VRLHEPDAQEEGAVLELVKVIDRGGGRPEIGLILAIARHRYPAVGALLALGSRVGVDRPGTAMLGFAAHRPGARVVETYVEDLADLGGRVAIIAEVLRQSDDVRHGIADPCVVVGDVSERRAPSAEQRRARGIAQRILAVSLIEANRSAGQAVDIRRFHFRGAVAAEARVEVVNGDEQDVRLLGGGESGRGCQGPQKRAAGERSTWHRWA
jgi:hypothetical protein